MISPKILLIILDGFGDGKDYPFNAIARSRMPFFHSLEKKFPRSQLLTSGEAVGLPEGIMGNSEVGHLNMGAGRIVYQELTRIDKAIHDKEFQKNQNILTTINAVKKTGGTLHLMGLLSDAGVHSHMKHLEAIIALAFEKGVPVTVHAFTDGRDTPPYSSLGYMRRLMALTERFPNTIIGTIMGRYFAMDRDNRWDRVEKAWNALLGRIAPTQLSADKVIETSHAAQITDEFIEPVLLSTTRNHNYVQDGDGIFFYNFRADRARQLTRAFTQKDFKEFNTGARPHLSSYLCMTEYDKTYGLPVAYPPQNLSHMLPDILESHQLTQYRIAETEKYAHVTFFFNGSREALYKGEDRALIPSVKDVPTYDLKPEMSAGAVTDNLVERLNRGDKTFLLVNYANPDMVGHTGNFDAAVKSLEFIDHCLERVVTAALAGDYAVIISSDHGNVEEMRECNQTDHIHTQHTLNPVPILFISNHFKYRLRDGGVLADIAPSILELLSIPQPAEMTGRSLLVGTRT